MTKILVVEDEFLLREWVEEELHDAGFAVRGATSGDEALSILSEGGFDVLLTDIRMPGQIDGWELGGIARERQPAIKIIYVTGYSQQPPALQSSERFLRKPYRIGEVFALIEGLTS